MEKDKIEKATLKTVHEQNRNGQAVYIGNYLIATAAHCFQVNLSGGIVLGDHVIFNLETPSGVQLYASPAFMDPVSDLCILEPCDIQEHSQLHEQYCGWCDETEPVLMRREPIPPFEFSGGSRTPEQIPCHCLSHTGDWISGYVERYSSRPWMGVGLQETLLGGTSGGPIVDDDGLLLGVVSNARGGLKQGHFAIPQLSLPVWILDAISAVLPPEH